MEPSFHVLIEESNILLMNKTMNPSMIEVVTPFTNKQSRMIIVTNRKRQILIKRDVRIFKCGRLGHTIEPSSFEWPIQ